MSTIRIHRRHELSEDLVRSRAEQFARKIQERLQVAWHWEGEHLLLKAPPGPARGAHGRVTMTPRNVSIEIALPLALRPVKSLVESKLQQKLDLLLSPA